MRRFHFNDIKLRDKLLLMYVMSVFIPIVLTNVIFYQVTATNVKNQKIRDANIAMEKTIGELQDVFDQAVGISYHFYLDSGFNEAMNREYSAPIRYIEAYESYLRGVLAVYSQTNLSVGKLTVYTDNETIMTSGHIERLTEAETGSDWYRSLREVATRYPVLYHHGGSFSMLQWLSHFSQGSRFGNLIKIDLNMNEINALFRNSAFDGELYLLSPSGSIAYSTDRSLPWHMSSVTEDAIPSANGIIPFSMPLASGEYMKGWSLYGVMDQKIVLEEVYKSRYSVLYLAILNFVLPTLILAFISRSVHTRLVRILKHMKKVKGGTFEPIARAEDRDEIGQLTMEFNRMTHRIRSLIDDVYIADIEKKDLELKRWQTQLNALHSQINPHFLFNALETIRMRSLMKGEKETAKIILDMSKILRKSITWGKDWITIDAELELIGCFLEIQKYRFGDKLEYVIHVDETLKKRMIPKMTFLPFVENASIHGIESSPRNGLITIDIYRSGEDIVFSLQDNGTGMTEETMNDLLAYMQDEEATRDNIGMKNAYSRLRMLYKEAFRFRLDSEPGSGTTVEIKLPMIY